MVPVRITSRLSIAPAAAQANSEVEGFGYAFGDLRTALQRYGALNLKNGWNETADASASIS